MWTSLVVGIVFEIGGVDIVGVYRCRCRHRCYNYHVVFFAKGKPGAHLCLRNRSRFSFFHFLSPFYHHDNSINVAASFENFFIIQLIHSMLKNSSHSIKKLMNVPSVIRIRNCLHQKRFPFDFSGAIDCVTKANICLIQFLAHALFDFLRYF